MEKRKQGLLVYNHSLWSGTYEAHLDLYVSAGATLGVDLTLLSGMALSGGISGGALSFGVSLSEVDFVLFLDKDVALARMLEGMGMAVYNSSDCVSVCDSKIFTAVALAKHGVPTVDTRFAPLSFRDILSEEEKTAYLWAVVEDLGLPLVVKEAYGSYGEQVYLAEDMEALSGLWDRLQGSSYLFQRYVISSVGRDVRIFVVGDTVVGGMYRENENDFRANLSIGGSVSWCEPTEDMRDLAVSASLAVGAVFSGVDLLFGEDGGLLVCEVNSSPHIKNYFDGFGVNLAEDLFRWILAQGG